LFLTNTLISIKVVRCDIRAQRSQLGFEFIHFIIVKNHQERLFTLEDSLIGLSTLLICHYQPWSSNLLCSLLRCVRSLSTCVISLRNWINDLRLMKPNSMIWFVIEITCLNAWWVKFKLSNHLLLKPLRFLHHPGILRLLNPVINITLLLLTISRILVHITDLTGTLLYLPIPIPRITSNLALIPIVTLPIGIGVWFGEIGWIIWWKWEFLMFCG
jgi:hypothetical protein